MLQCLLPKKNMSASLQNVTHGLQFFMFLEPANENIARPDASGDASGDYLSEDDEMTCKYYKQIMYKLISVHQLKFM